MSLNFITGSIQAKLIAVLLVMFGTLAATIGMNFQTIGSLENSTPMVNQAGAQRMRAYKAATRQMTTTGPMPQPARRLGLH
jgi:nitrate/nitrite-specific signal transduction histidine kinase